MKTQLPSLITSNPEAGLLLARQLAEKLQVAQEQAGNSVERPGGMNYSLPPSVPVEIISSILFYAITAANNGWTARESQR